MKRITVFSIGFFLIAFTAHSKLTAQNLVLNWGHIYGSPSADVGESITIDSDGNVYTVGYFSGEIEDQVQKLGFKHKFELI